MRTEPVHHVVVPVSFVLTAVASAVSFAIWMGVRFAKTLARDESPPG
jgi:hypothetical protein